LAPQTSTTISPDATPQVGFTTPLNVTTSQLITVLQNSLHLSSPPTIVNTQVVNSQRYTVLSFSNSSVASQAVAAALNNEIPGVLAASPIMNPTTASPSASGSNGPLIGGIIGGLVGLVILIIVVKYVVCSDAGKVGRRRFDDDFVMTNAQSSNMMSFEELLIQEEEMRAGKDITQIGQLDFADARHPNNLL
jgi:hypothetical protein